MADERHPGDHPKKEFLQEDSILARLRSASGGELAGLTSYVGLLGRSIKEGYWLLYPTLDMSTSLEIEESDIVHSVPLAPEQSPFEGLGGTRVFVRKGAQVTTTRTVSRAARAGNGDEFALDSRAGQCACAAGPAAWRAPTQRSGRRRGATSPELDSNVYVQVLNNGWFVAAFHLTHYAYGEEVYQYSGHILKGSSTRLYMLPGAAGLHIEEWWGFGWKEIFSSPYYVDQNTCFEVWGTTLYPDWRSYRCGPI